MNFTDDELSIAPEADTPSINTKAWGIQATADTYSFGVGYFDFYCRAAASRIKRRGNLVTVRAVFSPSPPYPTPPCLPLRFFQSPPKKRTTTTLVRREKNCSQEPIGGATCERCLATGSGQNRYRIVTLVVVEMATEEEEEETGSRFEN